ncbi:MAG: ATP synthase F1 subunit gamma [Candidatus Curtissbacteria bacterium]|nr:ATP synthase F1 subunit gamma [Candidatus Curtissbacteria bacterium]MDZ4210024.1 ATP synthase F1 subunit gamma [Candidatus Curtissbacteria bacterium]
MAQIREIKRRIKSINNTAKVTHAMELVSAAKMRKSQEAALASRPYTGALTEILNEVKSKSEKSHTLLKTKDAPNKMIILITSDRGLVGGLNINLFREIAKSELKNIKFVVVGKKGQNFAAKTGSDLIAGFVSDEQETLDLARTLTKIAVDAYQNSEVNSVRIMYPNFQSTVKQIPALTQLLPIEMQTVNSESSTVNHSDLLLEPSADRILESILPHFVLTKIYQTLLEAKASEHSARMVAMKNATDAASDLVDDLTLTYNQARQEAITKELLDIITAQSAFE